MNSGNGGSELNDWTVMSAEAQTALGVTGNQTAPLNLDATNGQVCFQRSTTKIACVNWGAIGGEVSGTSRTDHVPTPPDGQSVQLCGSTYVIGTPTPKAANACPSSGGGGGGTGGGGAATPPAADRPPTVTVGGAARQKLKAILKVPVSCPTEPCSASAVGTISIPKLSKIYRIKSASTQIAEGGTTSLRLRIVKKTRNKIKAALKKGEKVKAKLTITATNTAGTVTAKKTVKFKR